VARRAVLALIVVIWCGRVLAEEPKKTSPTVARETADANAKTPAGRRYESALESSLDGWLRKALERCVKGISKDDAISFDALVRVGSSGEAEEVLFAPETAVGRCAEPDFRRAKYPSPPQPSWWVKIEVGLK
jgi:hypothetical protein